MLGPCIVSPTGDIVIDTPTLGRFIIRCGRQGAETRLIKLRYTGAPTPLPILRIDAAPGEPNLEIDGTLNGDRIDFALPEQAARGWGAWVVVGGNEIARLVTPVQPGTYLAEDPPVNMDPPSLAYAPAVESLQAVWIEGGHFHDAHGRWFWKGVTEFCLYKRFLEGEDIRPILRQRREAGANLVRVLMQMHYITRFYPRESPAFYDRLLEFNHIIYTEGMRWECTVFADENEVKSGRGHWDRITQALAGAPNVFVELVNEWPKNGIDPNAFSKPAGLLASQGSALSDSAPPLPGWDYHTWHGRRDWPKVIFSSEDAWYVGDGYDAGGSHPYSAKPVTHDEPMGFSAVDQPGRRSNSIELARQIGATCSTFCDGGTFHSDEGINSVLWGPEVDAMARKFFDALDGATSVTHQARSGRTPMRRHAAA